MELHNSFRAPEVLREREHLYIGRDGFVEKRKEPVLREHRLTLFLNGERREELVCLPQHLPELIAGHLLTEGLAASAEDIREISIDATGAMAQVTVADLGEYPMTAVEPMLWRADWIFALADLFAAGMPLHEQTWATHSAFLGRAGACLFSCEDIGRHNALDKAVGYAVLHGTELRECYLYSSGRMPSDMVKKAVRAGIPLLAAKASPTEGGVRVAGEYGLTLVCAARRDRMKLFTGNTPMNDE